MDDKLITLASLPYPKAEILRSLLEADGIDCLLENVDFLQDAMDTGVQIRVREQDARQAFPVLEKMLGKVSTKNRFLIYESKVVPSTILLTTLIP